MLSQHIICATWQVVVLSTDQKRGPSCDVPNEPFASINIVGVYRMNANFSYYSELSTIVKVFIFETKEIPKESPNNLSSTHKMWLKLLTLLFQEPPK